MVHKKKKKNAGRGCVLFLFQRHNVEVCFTCPALHQCTESVGSTKNILFTANLCLSTAQENQPLWYFLIFLWIFPGIYIRFGAMRSPTNSAINPAHLFLAALISYAQSERLSFPHFLPTDDFQLIIENHHKYHEYLPTASSAVVPLCGGAEIPVSVTLPNTLPLKYSAG